MSPSVPVEIRVTLGTNTATPVTLSLPNCFAFGTATSSTPTITAVLPSSGTNEGKTRVTIVGSGFQAPVQVFFGDVEATIVSVSFNQIVVLTPPAFGSGRDNLNELVDVRVRNVTSGVEATLTDGYRYTQPLQLIAVAPSEVRLDQPFPPVTIFGHGFQAPAVVTLAGRPAIIVSISESELVVLPGRPDGLRRSQRRRHRHQHQHGRHRERSGLRLYRCSAGDHSPFAQRRGSRNERDDHGYEPSDQYLERACSVRRRGGFGQLRVGNRYRAGRYGAGSTGAGRPPVSPGESGWNPSAGGIACPRSG